MQQVEIFLGGERNYKNIQGDTGPLVYPAGFLYIFSVLYWLTDAGSSIIAGQIIFAAVLILTVYVNCRIYSYSKKVFMALSKVPMYAVMMFLLSKRIHSIFLLRLFNDTIAMLILNISILCILQRRWNLSAILFRFL
jgi:alpha-1,3-mannosyltransferase